MIVWILSAIKSQTLGQQPHTAMALFTAGVIIMSIIGAFLQSRAGRIARQ
jgi:hypothetical protein